MKKFFILFVALWTVACADEKPLTLAQAVDADDIPAVQAALERGESINSFDESGKTALMSASENGQTELVKLLLFLHANPNIPARDPHAPGTTALMLASQHNHADVATLLLDAGANAEQPNQEGKTPLMAASEKGHTEMVELLLKERARIDAQNKGGVTALMLAAHEGHVHTVQQLLKAGADPKITDAAGHTAVYYSRKPRLVLLLQGNGK